MPAVAWSADARVAAPAPDAPLSGSQGDEGSVPNTPTTSVPPESAESTQAGQGTPGAQAAPDAPQGKWVAAEDAAEWNSLLIWARRQRGPQWDTGTGMYVFFLSADAVGKCRMGVSSTMGRFPF